MPRPRVLLLDHTAQEGGAELALVRLAAAIGDRADLDALLFADGPVRARLTDAGVRTAIVKLDSAIATASRGSVITGIARSAGGALAFIPRLTRAIRESHANLVVANSLKSAVFAGIAAPLAGRRWVWHLHDRLAPDYLPRPLVHAMHLLASFGPQAIVVNSRATLETLPARARRKSTIAYPGLPAEAFSELATPDPAAPLVGIVGRISPTKGQREFLIAASAVADIHPDVRFAVVGAALFGEGEYETQLAELADTLGIGERTDFTGWVDDAPERMRRMTVVVHASPVPEPFGQVVAEAMAAGVPVIAAASGGVTEILDPAGSAGSDPWGATSTGILVRPEDPQALAAAINDVLTYPSAASSRAAAARNDARHRFTIEQTADAVWRVWASLFR